MIYNVNQCHGVSLPSESFAHLDAWCFCCFSVKKVSNTQRMRSCAASRHLLAVAALPKAAKRSLFLSEPFQLITGRLLWWALHGISWGEYADCVDYVRQERGCRECRPTIIVAWWFQAIAINSTAKSTWFIIPLAHVGLESICIITANAWALSGTATTTGNASPSSSNPY